MNNYIKEIKAIFIFLIVFIIFFFIIYLIKNYDPDYTFLGYFVGYLVLISILTVLSKFIKLKVFREIVNVVSYPAGFFYIIGILILPFMELIKNSILYFSFVAGISYYLFWSLEYFDLIESPDLFVYLTLTFAVFTAVLFNFQIRKLINYISPGSSDSPDKILKYKEISDYLLSENNIRFTIYSVYVVVLVYNNILSFQTNASDVDVNFNKAILQSFVTFIAFERSLSILKTLKFKPSDLLDKIHGAISNHVKEMNRDS